MNTRSCGKLSLISIKRRLGFSDINGVKNRTLNVRAVRAELARLSVGRMFLHVACALRDGRVQWHWEGIKRELPLQFAQSMIKTIRPRRINRRIRILFRRQRWASAIS